MEVQIVARELIKPSSSTPKIINISRLDQVVPPDPIKLLYFYQNNSTADTEKVIAEQTRHLKSSLSKVLTLFYPYAGKVRDNFCVTLADDDGVEFLEAQVNGTLLEYLVQPKIEILVAHLNANFNNGSCTFPLMIIQASFFTCGGLSIGVTFSHKVSDATSSFRFANEWAKIAMEKFDNVLGPDFSASIVFPPINHVLATGHNQTLVLNCVTRRFMFSASNIASLQERASKEGARKPSRVETITAFIWRIGMKMYTSRSGGSQTPCILFMPVNLRRILPPLCAQSFGNLIQVISVPNNNGNTNISYLITLIREKIAALRETCDNKLLQGEELFNLFAESFRKVLLSLNEPHLVDALTITSSCGMHMYDADFGWGKPTWVSGHNHVCYSTTLMDTRDGTGITASVSLTKDDMDLFASDEELLASAILDPSAME